jgi:aminoglycoside 3-N-acetyltransferase
VTAPRSSNLMNPREVSPKHVNITSWKAAAKAQLFLAVRRLLSQSKRTALKKKIVVSRKRLSAAYLVIYGRYSARELVEQLKNRVPENFSILMVHSSYDRLLPMYTGSPQDLVRELMAFCGRDRTLAMPAFMLGGRFYDKKQYFSKRAFDVNRTPSEMGILTEVFRRTPGVMRSLHPTHSVCAIGPLAQELTATHHLAPTRTGNGTPFETMSRKPTAIVGLGVEYYRCLAHTHTAEDTLGDDFPIKFHRMLLPVGLIDWNGNKLQYNLPIPLTSEQVDNTLLRSLLSEHELVEWRFRGTAMFVTAAGTITECLIKAAKNGVTVYRSSHANARGDHARD